MSQTCDAVDRRDAIVSDSDLGPRPPSRRAQRLGATTTGTVRAQSRSPDVDSEALANNRNF